MRFRDRFALNVPPLLIRLVLAVTFLWAGLGKVMGVYTPAPEHLPVLEAVGAVAPLAGEPTPDSPTLEPIKIQRVYSLVVVMDAAAAPPTPAATEENPTPEPPAPILPSQLAGSNNLKLLAWAAALTEIFAGLFLLFGLLTRISALSLVGVMGMAIWLTTIGPAIQSGSTVLGFIPDHDPWDVKPWVTPLWQFALLFMALASAGLGSGALGLDRAIFSSPTTKPEPAYADDDEDDD